MLTLSRREWHSRRFLTYRLRLPCLAGTNSVLDTNARKELSGRIYHALPVRNLAKIGNGLRALQCAGTAFMICVTFRQPRNLLAGEMVTATEGGLKRLG